MGFVLSVYSREAFKEYVMPAINNADYAITLNKHFFNLKNEICLEFEVINQVWKIKTGKTYRIYRNQRELREKTELDASQILQISTIGNKQLILMVRMSDEVFHAFQKYDIQTLNHITIGEDAQNLIRYNYQRLISKEHAVIRRQGKDCVVICKGQNGLYVNAKLVTQTEPLRFGDYINIYSLHIVYLGDILAIDTGNENVSINEKRLVPIVGEVGAEPRAQAEDAALLPTKKLFHRSPRIIEKIESDPIEIEEPPKGMNSEKKPLIMTIGPSFTMAIPMLLGALLMMASSRASGGTNGLFMYSGLLMALSSAAIGVAWALANLRYQKKTEAENETHRYEAYSNYLLKKTEEIKEKYAHNQGALNRMYPDAQSCLSYDEKSAMLWNRNTSHEDFLRFRLGLGDIDFQVPIEIPKERFHLDRDELAEKPEFIVNNYKTLTKVPILLDLMEHRLVGVIGDAEKKNAIQVAKVLAAQIAACNCYTDVKLIFVYDENNSMDAGEWEFARWLPHVWSEDKKIRYIASNRLESSDVFYEVAKVLRQRAEDAQASSGSAQTVPRPYFVMFLSDPTLIEEEMIAKYVFETGADIGLRTVMLSTSGDLLPNACEYIVECDNAFQGMYNVSAQKEDRAKVLFDAVDSAKLDQFSRRLSNIEVQETETGGEIPNALTFFDMHDISHPADLRAEERWLKNRNYDNIRGLIGQKSGGAPCYLDVHEKYHGPHGLVAGTTGSGKSETLQTYMLSLAINYSPDDIGFFIIDYKGGGMANLFDGLPHMIGQISNLSGNQVFRAMVSIKSENRRRQRIFSEHGVNNINNYTKLYKNKEASEPVPHLFIIIDEFAELKREEPDFMKELISVAQVGRSLGVHLILATQKPSGTVDDNIWSNSKFRLCLRVQDRQDSNDMLHKPDAAYITQAGRCYLQVGNDEVYELFQSGFSGAPYDEALGSEKAVIATLLTANGKTEQTGGLAHSIRKEKALLQWVENLMFCLENTAFQDVGFLETLAQNGEITEDAAEAFYGTIAFAGLDYQKSKYNLLRLEDFMRLYGQAQGQGAERAAEIVRLAASQNVKLPELRERTQLDAIKDYLQKTAQENGYRHNHQLWMPVLSDHIYLQSFAEYQDAAFADGAWKTPAGAWSLEIPIGMVDDPQNQAQLPLMFSLSEGGHHAIIGSVVSGKSTLMQTMIYGLVTKYAPEYLNVYALDFSSKMMSAFQGLPHFGGIMYEGDDEKIAKFFNLIARILDERKVAFRGGNYSQYVKVHGMEYPAIVIAIDNFSAFKEKTAEAYVDQIVRLSKEGVNHGIFLLLCAGGFGMNEIPGRIGENLKTVLCLELPDKFAYADMLHTNQIEVLPETGIKGRGLALFGSRVLEYQAALALEAEDDYQRMERIAAMCAQMKQSWDGKCARQIPEIPEKPIWDLFVQEEGVKSAAQIDHMLPVGYNMEDADIYSIDLSDVYCYLIAGQQRTGRKNYLRVMLEAALLKHAHICLIDGTRQMQQLENQEGITYLAEEEALLGYFKETLTPEFQKRNQIKAQLLQEGYEEAELYEYTRKETPYFLFISDLSWFFGTVYSAQNKSKGMRGFMETLIAKGRYHNIYFVGVLDLADKTTVRAYHAFQDFVADKAGIHFGGNVTQNPFLNFDYLSFKEQSVSEKPGIGQISGMGEAMAARKIAVPLIGRRKTQA